jgi:ribosomal protein S27AE
MGWTLTGVCAMVDKKCPHCGQPYFMGETQRMRTCDKCHFPLISDKNFQPDVLTVYQMMWKWIQQNISTTHQTSQEILQRQNQEIKALRQQLASQPSVKPRLPEFGSIKTSAKIDDPRIQFELKQTALLAHLQQESLRLRQEVSQLEQENQHLDNLNTQLKDQLEAEQFQKQDLNTRLELISKQYDEGICDWLKAAELGQQVYYLADARLRQMGHLIQDTPSIQHEAAPDSPIGTASEIVPDESFPKGYSADLPWLKLYNQDSGQFAAIANPIEIAATGTSLGDRWVARGTPATFEEGAGSYFLIETNESYYLVPNRKRFHFNESSLDSIQVCFEFNQSELNELSDSDLSQYDLTQFEVVYPAEVVQNETSQWQLQQRGLIRFQLRDL